MAMEENDAKIQASSALGSTSRWFHSVRQTVPRSLVDNYLCMRVTRSVDTAADNPSVHVVNSTASGVVNAMVWWQPQNPTAVSFGISQSGTVFRSRVFQTFGEFRCRCMKITLIPQLGMPEVNQFRLHSYLLFPPHPINKDNGFVYDPNAATEYPRFTDVREADDFIVKLGSHRGQTLTATFVPQVNDNNYGEQGPGEYTSTQMPWTDTNSTSEGFAMRMPWFGWHVPDTSPNVQVMAVYQVIVEAIYEFRNPNNTL